ncbi:MAG: response regulator, partial [Pseudoalteromonas tetraodonis]
MEPSILLVDDEVNVLRSLRRVLQRAGFKVSVAESGPEALEYLKTSDVSIIVTDYRMPNMTGADLLREVKIHWPEIINIVLSGHSDFNSVVELLNQGLAIKFLQKPWNENELITTIEQAQQLYCKRIAQHERDQLLLGSVTALIEIDENGKINRFNAPAQSLFSGLYSFVDDYIINIDAQPNKDDLTAFLSNKTNMLFIARKCAESEKEYEFILERYWSDDFCQLLKLSVNPSKSSNKFLIESFGDFLIKEPAFYQQLNEYEGENTSYTVIFIGIAKFELIADLLDYQSAYEFTHLLAKVLHNTFGEKVRMCQKHSNQFMLSVPHASNDATLLAALNKTMSLFSDAIPQRYKGMSLELYGVYGIFPEDVLSGKELINHLSLNMNYLAKKQQRFFTRFDAELVNDYRKNFELSRLLFKAIDNEEFSLCFQPKIDLTTHKVSGAEVLIRWYEPTKYGWVSPSLFIPISECDGQIIAISRFVISQSFKQLKQWNLQKVEVGKLAINLSARQI